MAKEIFYFTKKERRQLIKLIVVVICFISINTLIITKPEIKFVQKDIVVIPQEKKVSKQKKESVPPSLILKSFDPNTVNKEELAKMNLPQKGIKSLINYRRKGGYIKNIHDFKKMYGFENLNDSLLSKHLHFTKPQQNIFQNHAQKETGQTHISEKSKRVDFDSTNHPTYKPYTSYYKKKTIPEEKFFIGINSADTSRLQKLKGIGPFRANMIVKFRTALGGYHSIEQLREVHYLPDSIINKIADQIYLDSIQIKKIKLNHSSQQELKAHPYIDWQEAKMLYNFAKEHGPIREIEHLNQIRGLDSSFIFRIEPYLDLGES